MANIGDIVGRITLDSSNFNKNIGGISKAFNGLSGAAGKVGAALTASITIPLVKMAATSIAAARDFETAFTGVKKTVEGTKEQFSSLRSGILDMTTELPSSASEIAKVVESGGQLGIQTENLLTFTRTMIDLGNTTNLSSEQAATALARFANITEASQEQFSNMGSTIVSLGNNLATTEAEITNMGLRLAGAGKSAGLAHEDILSIAAALSSVGIKAQSGGTAFSRVFIKMGDAVKNGGGKLEEFARVAGLSAEEFSMQFEAAPSQAIESFVQGLGRMQAANESTTGSLGQLGLGEIRVRDALTRLANNTSILTQALNLGTTAWKENIALTKEAELRYGTTDSTIERLNNAIDAAKISLGDALLPVVNQIAQALIPVINSFGEFIGWFKSLDAGVKSTALIFGTVFAVGGPIILALTAFFALVATLSAPLLAGGAVVLGLIAGVTAIATNWEAITAKLRSMWKTTMNNIRANIQANIENIQQAWNSLKSKTLNIITSIVDGIFVALNRLSTLPKPVQEFVDKTVGAFAWAKDILVGNSIVPDMIDDIGEEFNRLDTVMVTPSEMAVERMIKSFERLQGDQGREGPFNGYAESARMELTATSLAVEENTSHWKRLLTEFKFTAQDAFEQLGNSMTQVLATIRTSFVNTIVNMVDGTATFKDLINEIWRAALSAFLNYVIQMGARWAATQLAMTAQSQAGAAAHTAVEGTKTAVTAAAETARAVLVAAGTRAVLGAAASSIAALAAVGSVALTIVTVIVAAVAAVFAAIAAALSSTSVGATMATEFAQAAAVVGAGGAAAIAAAGAAVAAAVAGGYAVIGGLAATPFAEGGAVFGPTLALVGEGGEPEVIAPFSEIEKMLNTNGSGEQQINVILDGRIISRSVMRHMPKVVRMQGIPL